jgi:hypothetical protein
MSDLKEKSLGFLLGRLLVLAHKVIQQSDNEELVMEAEELLKRWETEKRSKNKSDKCRIDIYKISKN